MCTQTEGLRKTRDTSRAQSTRASSLRGVCVCVCAYVSVCVCVCVCFCLFVHFTGHACKQQDRFEIRTSRRPLARSDQRNGRVADGPRGNVLTQHTHTHTYTHTHAHAHTRSETRLK